MNIVYALTVDSTSRINADMNLVSAWSVRHSNPEHKITVVCDHKSLCILKKVRHKILEEADCVVDAGKMEGGRDYINRFIKTSLNQYVDGDFLYLDADTFVRKSLDDLLDIDCDMAGVANHNNTDASIIPSGKPPWGELEKIKDLGWDVPKFYINGGVLWIKNSTNTRKFFEVYHTKWLQSFSLLNDHRDQHALNSAIEWSQISLKILPKKYNAQGYCASTEKSKPKHNEDTVVYHTYGDLWKNSLFIDLNSFEEVKNLDIKNGNIWK